MDKRNSSSKKCPPAVGGGDRHTRRIGIAIALGIAFLLLSMVIGLVTVGVSFTLSPGILITSLLSKTFRTGIALKWTLSIAISFLAFYFLEKRLKPYLILCSIIFFISGLIFIVFPDSSYEKKIVRPTLAKMFRFVNFTPIAKSVAVWPVLRVFYNVSDQATFGGDYIGNIFNTKPPRGIDLSDAETSQAELASRQTEKNKNMYLTAITDIKTIGAVIERYRSDFSSPPVHESIRALSTDAKIIPHYIRVMPVADPWGNEYLYQSSQRTYWIGCTGSDAKFSGFDQAGRPEWQPGVDLVYMNGDFRFGPKSLVEDETASAASPKGQSDLAGFQDWESILSAQSGLPFAKSVIGKQISVMEGFADAMKQAETDQAVAASLNAFTADMKKLMPFVHKLSRVYDRKKPPAELQPEMEKVEISQGRSAKAIDKATQFSQSAVVSEALAKFKDLMAEAQKQPDPERMKKTAKSSEPAKEKTKPAEKVDSFSKAQIWGSVKTGDSDLLKKIIASGANVRMADGNGASLIMWAAYLGNGEMVKELLKNGADPKKKGIIWTIEDKSSWYGSALGAAAGGGFLEIVKLLVEDGKVDVNDRQLMDDGIPDGGWTPLMEAGSKGHLEIVVYLLEKRASIYLKDRTGATAVDLAKNRKIARLLRES